MFAGGCGTVYAITVEVPPREARQCGGEAFEGRDPGAGAGDQADPLFGQPSHPPDDLLGELGAEAWGKRPPVVTVRGAHCDPDRHDVTGDVFIGLDELWSGQSAVAVSPALHVTWWDG